MKTISDTIAVLSSKNFTVILEDGRTIQFFFKPNNFFHLLGLQHLEDMPSISNAKNKASIAKQLGRDVNLFKQIKQSAHYYKIQERIETFEKIAEMLLSDKCEIVINFDKSRVPSSKIISTLLFFKTDDHIVYYMLGLAEGKQGNYYPETYIVEHSRYYISNQDLLYCDIRHEDFIPAKRKTIKQQK